MVSANGERSPRPRREVKPERSGWENELVGRRRLPRLGERFAPDSLHLMYIQATIFTYSQLHIREVKAMSLYIRDDDVDALARKVQQATKAPTKTEAVRRALQNELARAEQAVPLKERVKKIQDSVRAKMGPNMPDFDMKKFTDEMWEV